MAKRVWQVAPISPDNPAEFLMYLVRRHLGDDVGIVQADLTSPITWETYQVGDAEDRLVATGTLTVSSSIFDVPLTGSAWPLGNPPGFNFAGRIPGSGFPAGNMLYLARFIFTLVGSGDVFEEWAQVQTLDVPVP